MINLRWRFVSKTGILETHFQTKWCFIEIFWSCMINITITQLQHPDWLSIVSLNKTYCLKNTAFYICQNSSHSVKRKYSVTILMFLRWADGSTQIKKHWWTVAWSNSWTKNKWCPLMENTTCQLYSEDILSSNKVDMQKLKPTFISSLSCSSPCIRDVTHSICCQLLMLAVKLFLSTSTTEQDAEGYRMTVAWFNTTFGQTSQHDSAV